MWKGVVTEPGGIDPESSGEVTIWENGLPTTWKVTAHLNWMHNDLPVAYGTKVLVWFFEDEDKFVFTNGDC
jgi:hypothetical protein